MKLGTETGSLVNHLQSRAVRGQPQPGVGMGATMLSWTDRYAATVVAVEKGGEIVTVRRDHAKRIDTNGVSDCQSYEYSLNLNGSSTTFRRSKNGQYREVYQNDKTGRWNKTNGWGLMLGHRDEHHDFSF